MKIAIFGRLTENTDFLILEKFFETLDEKGLAWRVDDKYAVELKSKFNGWEKWIEPFPLTLISECNFAFSFGGDGTFLNTTHAIGTTGIPLLGVNFGRMGFLASISQKEIIGAVEAIQKGMYKIEKRTGLIVESNPEGLFPEGSFGLNDLTIHKNNSNEMITIHTYINGEFLNSYWGDGLIISSPTGSTAYSLSCGGPVIHPLADALVITPVAPHSLTVRPMIIPGNYVISFEIESRSGQAMVALDTRSKLVNQKTEIAVKKSDFHINLLRVTPGNYLNTLRKRLMWGSDIRNE